MKKTILLLLLTSILLGGCSYGTDVERQAFVVAVGIDKGEVFPLKITFVFANPGGSSGGEESEPSSPKPDIVTVEAPTIFSATKKLDAIKSKVLNMSHVKIVVFSEETAKGGIKNFLKGFASSRDFRPNTYICVSKGSAEKYLKSVKPAHEIFIEKYYDNIMEKVVSDKVNEAYLYYLYFNIAEDFSGSLVPLVGINNNKTDKSSPDLNPGNDDFSYDARAGQIIRDADNPAEIMGSAIFKNDIMAGTLGSFQTDLAHIICDEYYPRNYSINYPDDSRYVTFRLIQQNHPSVESRITKDNVLINIQIPVSIEYVDAGKIENNKKESRLFCDFLKKRLDKEADKLVKDSQQKYKSDFLGLGDSVKHHFIDMQQWKDFNWKSKFPQAKITVSFSVAYADFEEAN